MLTKNKMVLGVQMLLVSGLGFARLAFAEGIQSPIQYKSFEVLIAEIIKYALVLPLLSRLPSSSTAVFCTSRRRAIRNKLRPAKRRLSAR
jgi:hypothetical protein